MVIVLPEDKLRDAAAAFAMASTAMTETASALKVYREQIDDLQSRVSRNEDFRYKLYQLLKEYEDYG